MKIYLDDIKKVAVLRLIPYWMQMGCVLVSESGSADIHLSSAAIKSKPSTKVLLRIDSIGCDKDRQYERKNAVLSKSYVNANGIIYQSIYSKTMCEAYLSKRTTGITEVVYNGVDPVKWNGYTPHSGFNIAVCAKWRRWKRLREMIDIFATYNSKHEDAKLHIFGKVIDDAGPLDGRGIVYHGHVNHANMKKKYKEMDVMLHLAKGDWCPSSVVEAMASGMPIITTNMSGGTAELCGLASGCHVTREGTQLHKVDYIGRDRYNSIQENTKREIISILRINHKKLCRITMPSILNARRVAREYYKVMELMTGKKQ